jgi:hypothetical protein
MEKPSRGGEKRIAVWASPHEERGSDGAVAPPMCAHRVVLHRCVVREWCHPSRAAVAPGLHAAARTRRAARAVQSDVVSVWQVLPGTPSAPPIPAHRVARFDDPCTRNCLRKNKLCQRYSRCNVRRHRFKGVPRAERAWDRWHQGRMLSQDTLHGIGGDAHALVVEDVGQALLAEAGVVGLGTPHRVNDTLRFSGAVDTGRAIT